MKNSSSLLCESIIILLSWINYRISLKKVNENINLQLYGFYIIFYVILGNIYHNMNLFDRALNMYDKAIYYDGKYYHAFNNKGNCKLNC